ncbi:glycoside hydrolase family 16 protein [Aestuariibius sp. 2305UL40-4]|uniref:glycoside hydrolase family 16 protein n=1 Tax=Aestuariibius violaceus TaxID=3234132 RepID=UPI00345EBBEF
MFRLILGRAQWCGDGVWEDRALGGQRIEFEDHFDGEALDPAKWFAAYLPHWSALKRTRPNYRISDGVLRLFVAEDQGPWCPDLDGDVKVSNLQTGHFSGPLGSARGQHRFREGLVVREEISPQRLYVPHFGRVEMRARARLGPQHLAALWLIGFEEVPEQSGEITLMEVFGTAVGPEETEVVQGIKAITDPALEDELNEVRLPLRAEEWHVYGMDWTPSGVRFFVDGAETFRTRQAPDYPMQLMLNFYELPGEDPAGEGWFDVDYVRGFAPESGSGSEV